MKFKSFISKILVFIIALTTLSVCQNSTIAKADSFKVVTLGNDLTDEQKSEMLKYFNVTENDANILTITSEEEYEALGDVATPAQLGTRAISCSYVEPTTEGGLDIKSNNLTWVTVGMIRNALITAGITDAKVVVSAPFKVSGTAALTGVLKGFENSSSGQKIDEDKKEAANEEIVVTGDLGETIGQDDAANLMNDIKTEVIKKNPDSEKQLDKIIDKSVDKYEYDLSDEDKEKIKSVMTKINDLDIEYKSIKDQLNEVQDSLKDKISAEEVKGFFGTIGSFFSKIWHWFIGLFSSDDSSDSKETDTPETNTAETSTAETSTITNTIDSTSTVDTKKDNDVESSTSKVDNQSDTNDSDNSNADNDLKDNTETTTSSSTSTAE